MYKLCQTILGLYILAWVKIRLISIIEEKKTMGRNCIISWGRNNDFPHWKWISEWTDARGCEFLRPENRKKAEEDFGRVDMDWKAIDEELMGTIKELIN